MVASTEMDVVAVHTEEPTARDDGKAPEVVAPGDEEMASCGEMLGSLKNRSGADWLNTLFRVVAVCTLLYFFLFSLDLMGLSFKVLGGCDSGALFDGISNPIAGLMVGVIATVLVQSSSTTTSIVVSLVGASAMSVDTAIPVIMGANIGTSVTNTIVSMGQIGDPEQFKNAFAGATVHDMFNFLSVMVLLPIEIATGLLFHLTKVMMPHEDNLEEGESWEGPVKKWVGPLVSQVVIVNKKVASAIAKDPTKTCEELYAKGTKLIQCDKETGACPAFYVKDAEMSDDMASGGVILAFSLVLLCLCLALLVKVLNNMVASSSTAMLRRATSMHPLVAMLVGVGVTILVQSSSITTSVLTPLVGVGVLTVEQMFPLTLGANVGTTCTALLASLVQTKPEAVQIALCHFFFNVIGILIWFPLPFMRKIPLNAAKNLGKATLVYRATPLLYIAFAFVIAPGILLGLSTLYEGKTPFVILAVILTIFLAISMLNFTHWWFKRDGANKISTMFSGRQARAELQRELPKIVFEMQEDIQNLKRAAGMDDGFPVKTQEAATGLEETGAVSV